MTKYLTPERAKEHIKYLNSLKELTEKQVGEYYRFKQFINGNSQTKTSSKEST
jgi:hypothetical protein